jgi:hypothetical protein
MSVCLQSANLLKNEIVSPHAVNGPAVFQTEVESRR